MYLFHSAGAVAIAHSYTKLQRQEEKIDPTVRKVGSFDDPTLEGKSENSRSPNTSTLCPPAGAFLAQHITKKQQQSDLKTMAK